MAPVAAEGRLEEAEGRQTGGKGGHQSRIDLTAWDLFINFTTLTHVYFQCDFLLWLVDQYGV